MMPSVLALLQPGDTVHVTLRATVVQRSPRLKATIYEVADYILIIEDSAIVGVTVQKPAIAEG